MRLDFADKRVLVTGATRGIGRAAAAAFLAAGARVAVNGRTDGSVAAALAALDRTGRAVAAPGDVATAAGCEAVVELAVAGLGGLDVLVNSAGIGWAGPVESFDEAAWDATLDVNLKGTFFCVRAALPALRESRGNVVNLGSGAGVMGVSGLAVYCAAKGGVVNMTRALACEWAPFGIRVNAVAPTFARTRMTQGLLADAELRRRLEEATPLGRFVEPEEVAAAILFLAGDAASMITGHVLPVDGGWTAR